MSKLNYRVGQIVPSSNVTMETEIPALLRRRETMEPERFTFHSSRMRMKVVSKEELAAMDGDSDRCALELSDAAVDVMGYACLVAIMSMGLGYHRASQARLRKVTEENGNPCPVVSSAGALVDGLKTLGAKRIAILTPYQKPLTKLVCDYLENEGFEIHDAMSLEVANNLQVAALDPRAPIEHVKRLDTRGVDAIVASACVQMPSLDSIATIQAQTGIPTLSAAVATTHQMLTHLGLSTRIPDAGALLE